MESEEFPWIGDATEEEFSTSLYDLEKTIRQRKRWKRDIDPEYWSTDEWSAVKIAPEADHARANSKGSGDHNILHDDPEVVEEAAETYPFVREPEQDGDVVVSQGMSFVDAITSQLDQPLESIGGSWLKMVYAPEKGDNLDKVVISDNNETGEFIATLFPGGKTDEAVHAGKLSPEYADDETGYHPQHNIYMTALADQAVGRSLDTPEDIRNGELLIGNEIEAEEPVDWDTARDFRFELENVEEVDEEGHQIEATWNVTVTHRDGTETSPLSYTETSMYVDGFEELESVKEAYSEKEFFNPFMAVTREVANAYTSALRASTQAANQTQEIWLDMVTGGYTGRCETLD